MGNWRNKGVALFFAVLIWYVAFQAEKQEYPTSVRVEFTPSQADKEAVLITSVQVPSQDGGAALEFDKRVRIVFSGPRKQIERLRTDTLPPYSIEIPRGEEFYTFVQGDLGFPRDGVEIVQFFPLAVRIKQEEAVTLTVKNIAERVTVSHVKEGYEVASKEVFPGSVQISGPKSLVEAASVSAELSMEYTRERFEGKVDVVLSSNEDVSAELVRRNVRVLPQELKVNIALRASSDVLAMDAVRVGFRIPPMDVPIKIVLSDVPGDTIPVEFYGRKDEIARLRGTLREQPSFSLGVLVPPFDRELGGEFTFTEDSLELPGYTGVRIRQHESRRLEKKTAWSYKVVPVGERGG